MKCYGKLSELVDLIRVSVGRAEDEGLWAVVVVEVMGVCWEG